MKAFEATKMYFDQAADLMELSDNVRELLLTSKQRGASAGHGGDGQPRVSNAARLPSTARQLARSDERRSAIPPGCRP